MTQGGGKFIFRYRSVITGELANCVPKKICSHNEKLTVQRESNRKTTTIQRLSNQNQLNTMRITLNPTAVQRKNNQNR